MRWRAMSVATQDPAPDAQLQRADVAVAAGHSAEPPYVI